MNAPAPRYYVRVGADVRGPVDEATIVTWIAQGMRNAEVCPEGGQFYTRIEQTPLARHLASAPGGKTKLAKPVGIGTVVVVCLFSLGGRVMHVMNKDMEADKKEMTAALPTPGTSGVLHADKPLALCESTKYGWGWPCRGAGRVVPDGAPVQVMKAEVSAMDSLCRYWVTGGPAQGTAGDAPCAWFVPAR